MAETAPSNISIAPLNFASLSSPSSLANSYTFLVGIWMIIKDLARSALATVPGRRRRILFLVRWRIKGSLASAFFALAATPMIQAAFLVQESGKNLELLKDSRASRCGKKSSQGTLYRGRNLGEFTTHKAQRGNVKRNKFRSIPKGTLNRQIPAAS